MHTSPAVSVIVASVNAERTIRPCLTSLVRASEGRDAEIVLVDSSHDDTAAIARREFPHVRVESARPGALVPQLWSRGLLTTDAPTLAFTTAQFTFAEDWLQLLLGSLAESRKIAAVCGSFALDDGASGTDAAMFYLRYSAFLARSRTPHATADVAADNAVYLRTAVMRHPDLIAGGLWDSELNGSLKQDGFDFRHVPDAVARLCAHGSLREAAVQRLAHGTHFGAWRVGNGTSRLRVAAAAPIVPLVLYFRVLRRVWPHSEHRWRLLAASPFFLALAACWAAGEVTGAIRRRPHLPAQSVAHRS